MRQHRRIVSGRGGACCRRSKRATMRSRESATETAQIRIHGSMSITPRLGSVYNLLQILDDGTGPRRLIVACYRRVRRGGPHLSGRLGTPVHAGARPYGCVVEHRARRRSCAASRRRVERGPPEALACSRVGATPRSSFHRRGRDRAAHRHSTRSIRCWRAYADGATPLSFRARRARRLLHPDRHTRPPQWERPTRRCRVARRMLKQAAHERRGRACCAAAGILYAANSAGAAVGAMAAGFWLIALLGLRSSTLTAVALNVACALVALWMDRAAQSPSAPLPATSRGRRAAHKAQASDRATPRARRCRGRTFRIRSARVRSDMDAVTFPDSRPNDICVRGHGRVVHRRHCAGIASGCPAWRAQFPARLLARHAAGRHGGDTIVAAWFTALDLCCSSRTRLRSRPTPAG